jgi:hypothetical protein
MPGFSYFRSVLGLGALLSASLFAQNPAQTAVAASNSKVAHVEQVLVHAGDKADAALIVEIVTSGAQVAPDAQAITGPDRIVVDFPGALPAAALRALKINQGALKGIRTGLFANDPPITRVVLDLAEPQSYQISTTWSGTIITLKPVTPNPVKAGSVKSDAVKPNAAGLSAAAANAVANPAAGPAASPAKNPVAFSPVKSSPATSAVKLDSATFIPGPKPGAASSPRANELQIPQATLVSTARIGPAAKLPRAAVMPAAAARVAPVVSAASAVSVPPAISVPAAALVLDPVSEELPQPTKPVVSVAFANGMLSIHAERATLAQVLFEVQRQTQADIAIPAGAEQEEIIANLGPASARDVLMSLLNGSNYNFIFVGSQERLERVILTRRDPNIF